MLGKLTNLVTLSIDLESCEQLNQIDSLGKGINLLINLTSLDINLQDCVKLKQVDSLGEGLGQLTNLKKLKINLGSCEQLSQIDTLGIGLGNLNNLNTLDLNLEYCELLSQIDSFGKSLGQLTNLTTLALNLESCQQLAQIFNLSKGIGQLTNLTTLKLNLNYCEQLTQLDFLGTSMFERFTYTEEGKKAWQQFNLDEENIGNFGVGGDKIENILYRIQDLKLFQNFQNIPKLCIIMAGANDIEQKKLTPQIMFEGILQIVKEVEINFKNQTKIVVLGMFPRISDKLDEKDLFLKIQEFNNLIQIESEKNKRYEYNWFGKELLNYDEQNIGYTQKQFFVDNVHLSYEEKGIQPHQIPDEEVEKKMKTKETTLRTQVSQIFIGNNPDNVIQDEIVDELEKNENIDSNNNNIQNNSTISKNHYYMEQNSYKVYEMEYKVLSGNETKIQDACKVIPRQSNHTFQTHDLLFRINLAMTVLDHNVYTISKQNIHVKGIHDYMNMTQYKINQDQNTEQYKLNEDNKVDIILNKLENIKEFTGTDDEQEIEKILEDSKLLHHTNYQIVFLVNNDFVMYFKPNVQDFQQTKFNKSIGFKKRNEIHMVKIFQDMMFVSSGQEGLDIYQIYKSGEINHIQQITKSEFQKEDIDIQDISSYEGTLMVLGKKALYFFESNNQSENPYRKNQFEISIEGGITFDHYQKSIFVIGYEYLNEQQQKLKKINPELVQQGQQFVEIFVDWKNSFQPQYYVNFNIPILDDIYEIKMTKELAIIVQETVISLYYHGQYHKFLEYTDKQGNKNLRDPSETIERFEIESLKDIELIDPQIEGSIHSLMVGVNDRGVVLSPLNIIPSTFICSGSDNFQHKEQISVQLLTKELQCDLNDQFFTQCLKKKTINLQFFDEDLEQFQLLDENSVSIFNVMLIVGGLILTILILTICIIKTTRAIKQKVKEMQEEINSLKQYRHKYEQLAQLQNMEDEDNDEKV